LLLILFVLLTVAAIALAILLLRGALPLGELALRDIATRTVTGREGIVGSVAPGRLLVPVSPVGPLR
jgi:hypothetical protein